MKRFETGLRRLAIVLGCAWVVWVLFSGLTPGMGLIGVLVAISAPVAVAVLGAEVVLFVVRGFVRD